LSAIQSSCSSVAVGEADEEEQPARDAPVTARRRRGGNADLGAGDALDEDSHGDGCGMRDRMGAGGM
jgi:hypothetical protein